MENQIQMLIEEIKELIGFDLRLISGSASTDDKSHYNYLTSYQGNDIYIDEKATDFEIKIAKLWILKWYKRESSELHRLLLDVDGYKVYSGELKFPLKLWSIRFKNNVDEIFEVLTSVFEDINLVKMSSDEIVLFVSEIEIEPRALVDIIETETLTGVKIIIGEGCNQLSDLFWSYGQLSELLIIGESISQNSQVIDYEALVLPLIIRTLKNHDSKNRINELGSLLFHAISIEEELETTARIFFENNLNLTETASKLFIHRNTLIYRLNKLEAQTGYDIRKFNDAINYYIKYLIGKI